MCLGILKVKRKNLIGDKMNIFLLKYEQRLKLCIARYRVFVEVFVYSNVRDAITPFKGVRISYYSVIGQY